MESLDIKSLPIETDLNPERNSNKLIALGLLARHPIIAEIGAAPIYLAAEDMTQGAFIQQNAEGGEAGVYASHAYELSTGQVVILWGHDGLDETGPNHEYGVIPLSQDPETSKFFADNEGYHITRDLVLDKRDSGQAF